MHTFDKRHVQYGMISFRKVIPQLVAELKNLSDTIDK